MYKNVGKLIKKYTEIIVKICYALSGLAAVVIFAAGLASKDDEGVVISFLIAIFVFVVGCLSAWISGMFLYAYGEMADRVNQVDEKMDCVIDFVEEYADSTLAESRSEEKISIVYCEACGQILSKDAKFCSACGIPTKNV